MVEIRNDCVGCAVPGYPCMGDACPNRKVEHHLCDLCGCEETLYHFDGGEYCADCVLHELDIVEGT